MTNILIVTLKSILMRDVYLGGGLFVSMHSTTIDANTAQSIVPIGTVEVKPIQYCNIYIQIGSTCHDWPTKLHAQNICIVH